MLFNPLGGSYTPQANAQNNGNINFQQNQQQNRLTPEEIEKQAAASRAKRLQRLLGQLSDVLETAVEQTPDVTEAMETHAAYLEYILGRLQGEEQGLEPPEGFEDFAGELNALIDDVVRAWDALINASEIFPEDAPQKVFEDIDAVVAILENIASRRFQRMLSANWYAQWRLLYHDGTLSMLKDSHFSESRPDVGKLAGNADAIKQVMASSDGKNLLKHLLKDAMDMKNPDTDQPMLRPEQQEAVSRILNTLAGAESTVA